MKAKIFKYRHDGKIYYAEGYNEELTRLTLENYLRITPGTLGVGEAPEFNTELKLIWDKRNTSHVLTLTKEQTTSREELKSYREKQHCIYELNLLLKEDETFLNGNQGHIIADEENQVKFLNTRITNDQGIEVGHVICQSFKGSTDPEMTNQVYRFRHLSDAYKHVRSELIRLNLGDAMFNKNFSNLEICDSFIAGLNNADLYSSEGNVMVRTPHSTKLNPKFNV